jgi:HEAT repeat protein
MSISRNVRIAIVLGLIILLGSAVLLLRKRSPAPADSLDALVVALARPAAAPVRDSSVSPLSAAQPPESRALAATLRDSSWQTRLAAVNALRDRSDLTVGERAELLLAGLAREVDRPTESFRLSGGYLPPTSLFRLQFLRVLEGLGADAISPARQAGARAPSDTREWMLLARAGVGDTEVLSQIRELLRTSRDGAVRMTAARLLGRLSDRSAIPDLKVALNDPFKATTDASDMDLPPHFFYPVREQAAGALKALGLTVARNGDTFTAN